jgi:predicted acyl esterase
MQQERVPCLLEYIPYRKNDFTALRFVWTPMMCAYASEVSCPNATNNLQTLAANASRDSIRHRYFAGHGYASVRVDMRGSGDSDGVLLDEYLLEEHEDAVQVIAWLAAQPWCSGCVGMFGKSWGGFNALQVAALRPPALKAIITLCSTDDRFETDIHYMGGCHMAADHVSWAAYMLAFNARPPDPGIVGPAWKEMWKRRLEETPPFLAQWMAHQTRDAFWQHGSVCERYDAIQCPVLAVSGWADGYKDAVFRLLDGLSCPKLGIIGPWAHEYPEVATPGPAIGFLQECLRWWDEHLKGARTGIMEAPLLRAYIQDSQPPSAQHAYRPGRWVALAALDCLHDDAVGETWHLAMDLRGGRRGRLVAPTEERVRHGLGARDREGGRRGRDALRGGMGGDGEGVGGERNAGGEGVPVPGALWHGMHGGVWCNFGMAGDFATDQNEDDSLSLSFDAETVAEPTDYLGFPYAELTLTADQPLAHIAVRLCDVCPQGSGRRDFRVLGLAFSVLGLWFRVLGRRVRLSHRQVLFRGPNASPRGRRSKEA